MGSLTKILSPAVSTFEALERAGVTLDHFRWLRKYPDYAGRVAKFIGDGGAIESESQKIARSGLLPSLLFGPREWARCFGIILTDKQLGSEAVKNFPWGRDILNLPCPFTPAYRIWNTHFAFLGIDTIDKNPLSIQNMAKLCSRVSALSWRTRFFFGDNKWCKERDFVVKTTCSLRWYLMPPIAVPGSHNKPCEEQVKMLPPEYEVPTAVERTLQIILYGQLGGGENPYGPEKLENIIGCRCREMVSDCDCVVVDYDIVAAGLDIRVKSSPVTESSCYGIAASRKLPES